MARFETSHTASDLVGCCENGTELSVSIEVEELVEHLRLFDAKHNVRMELGAPSGSWTSYRLQIPGQYFENGNYLLPSFDVFTPFVIIIPC
jgi:hypothetical protein